MLDTPGPLRISSWAIVNATGYTLFRFAAAVLEGLPCRARSLVADLSALGYYCLSPGRRRNVRGNLSIIGEIPTRSEIYGVFRNHVINMMEMFASSRWSDAEISSRIEFPQREILDNALSAGRGVILATAHRGNWELPALLLGSLGYRLGVVAGIQMNPLLTDEVKRVKETRGIEVIGPEKPYRKLYRVLGEGGIVALLLDGDVFTGGSPVEIFGRKVSLPRGAARLAERTGAPVLGAYCRRLSDDRSRISMEIVLAAGEAARMGERASQERIYRVIEKYIEGNSDQWCIFRRFWEEAA
jgi:KDO2-lipid IV(A) lauroyltransferase